MNLQFAFNPFSIPIFLTSIIFLFLLRLSYGRDFKLGERYFALLMLSCFLYSLLYAIELLGGNTETIRLFYYLEFIGGVFVAPFLLLFVMKYSDQSKFLGRNLEGIIYGISVLFLGLVLTNEWHGLFYSKISAQHNGYFLSVALDKNVFHWLYAIYNSVLIIAANILLVRMLFSVPDIYKGQVLIMLFGTLIPWLAYVLVVFGNYPFGLDPVPFCLSISALVLFWALYRYQLFRTNPIAFKTIFENISDGIVIFDKTGEVVAHNHSARSFFEQLGGQKPTNRAEMASSVDGFSRLFSGEKKSIDVVDGLSGKSFVAYLREINGNHSQEGFFQYMILRDISDQKATEKLIRANEEKMQNVNSELLRKEKMLTSIAFATKELLSNRDFDIATQKAITLIGDGAGADRAYLFENREDENGNILSSQRFEWSALGVPPEIDNPNLKDLPIGMFGRAAEHFLGNNSFHGIVSQMDQDPELKELFQSQDILSVLLIPIYVEDHFWGFVGFDDCTHERQWSDAETALLISFADSISNAVERKNLEKNLIFSMEKAKEASVAKSEFLANMSHEIRTPLNGVIGFSDLLMKTHLEDNQKGYLKSIIQSGNLLLGLINDILDFSKIEAGKLELSKDWISIQEMAADTLKIIQPIADEKKLQLVLSVDSAVPNFVQGDLTRLKQIIINLLSNSGKFTHQGKIELGIFLDSHQTSDIFRRLVFSVKDTGIGISKDKEKTIFEAFAQEDNSTTRKYGGTGLGLTICSKLLELMDSRLELETEVGQGSNFFFSLELPYSEENPESHLPTPAAIFGEAVEPSSQGEKGHYKVLLVDDNPVNMLLAKSIVKKLLPSSDIAEAYNGAEAVAQYNKEVPDIIFMDIQMPEVSGYEATRQIRVIESGKHHTPIVALTAGTVKGEYDRCIEAGMDDYLSKPVLVSDIAGMIEKYLGSQPSPEQESIISSKFDEYRQSDPEFFKELVEVSISNIGKLKVSLHRHFQDGDLKLLKQTGHALKGVGLNLDFQELVFRAGEVERLTELNNATENLVNLALSEVDRILAGLEKELE